MKLTDKDIARFWKKVDRKGDNECWPWTASTTAFGYGQFGAQGKVLGAHRISFYLLYRRWPQVGRHTCDNPICCNPYHVIDGSQADNVTDIWQRGRGLLGELHPQSRHTDEDIRAIRELYADGKATQRELAARYGATQEWVGQVVRGERRAKAGGPFTAPGRGCRAA